MKENLLTTREVSHLLDVPEKDIIDLANSNLLPHSKLAGEFLRFKKDDVLKIKKKVKKSYGFPDKKVKKTARFREFFYFNDFYIFCSGVILLLLWIILKG